MTKIVPSGFSSAMSSACRISFWTNPSFVTEVRERHTMMTSHVRTARAISLAHSCPGRRSSSSSQGWNPSDKVAGTSCGRPAYHRVNGTRILEAFAKADLQVYRSATRSAGARGVRLEDAEVPDRLNRWHWVNLFESDGYQKLLRALRAREGTSGQARAATVPREERPVEVQPRLLPTLRSSMKSDDRFRILAKRRVPRSSSNTWGPRALRSRMMQSIGVPKTGLEPRCTAPIRAVATRKSCDRRASRTWALCRGAYPQDASTSLNGTMQRITCGASTCLCTPAPPCAQSRSNRPLVHRLGIA